MKRGKAIAGRLLSVLLVLVICLGTLPGEIFAAEGPAEAAGVETGDGKYRMSVMDGSGRSGVEDGLTPTEVRLNEVIINPEPTTYKLEYDANGGTIRSNGDSATTMTHEANSFEDSYTFTVKTAPETSTNFDPTWAGHELLGWADTKDAKEVIYQAGAQIKLDETAPTKTIYAVWEAIAPNKPTDIELYNLKLGVRIVCDVQGSGHKAMGYTLNTPKSVGTTQLKAISDVTANAGDNKDQYPYACTVSISTTQQNNYWLAQNMQGGTPKWNADHKLLDDAQDLAVTLYWNGIAWVDLGAPASGWHYMVIHTTHKPVDVTVTEPDPITRTFKVVYYNEPGADWMTVGDSAEKGFLNMPEWQKDEGVTENPRSIKISDNVPTRAGYIFDHWQWGGDTDQTFKPGDMITLTANPETLTEVAADLYAIWEEVSMELPRTGGTGIAPYIILGSTMALLAVLLLAGREKRR